MNTLTNYQQFQLQHYGNILGEDGFIKYMMPVNQQEMEDFEYGYNEAAAFEYYMRNGEESLLRELENNFPHNNYNCHERI